MACQEQHSAILLTEPQLTLREGLGAEGAQQGCCGCSKSSLFLGFLGPASKQAQWDHVTLLYTEFKG
eukprot:scaffold118491_cov18-Tisochrysis_lutea.AAC.3